MILFYYELFMTILDLIYSPREQMKWIDRYENSRFKGAS